MKTYLGIVFPDDLKCSYEDFARQYGTCHVFKKIPSDIREEKLREVYKIAVPDGNTKPTQKKGSKPDKNKG